MVETLFFLNSQTLFNSVLLLCFFFFIHMNTFQCYQVEKKKFSFNEKEMLIIANLFYGLIRISRKLIEKTGFYSTVVNFCAFAPHTYTYAYDLKYSNNDNDDNAKGKIHFMTIHQSKLTTKTFVFLLTNILECIGRNAEIP